MKPGRRNKTDSECSMQRNREQETIKRVEGKESENEFSKDTEKKKKWILLTCTVFEMKTNKTCLKQVQKRRIRRRRRVVVAVEQFFLKRFNSKWLFVLDL